MIATLQALFAVWIFTFVLGFVQSFFINYPPIDMSNPLVCLGFSLFIPFSTLFILWLIWAEISYRIDLARTRKKNRNAQW